MDALVFLNVRCNPLGYGVVVAKNVAENSFHGVGFFLVAIRFGYLFYRLVLHFLVIGKMITQLSFCLLLKYYN